MAKSSDQLALTQQLAANAASQADRDAEQVDKTAKSLEVTAKELRSMASDLGITGNGADAAWEEFNTLAKALVVRADQGCLLPSVDVALGQGLVGLLGI